MLHRLSPHRGLSRRRQATRLAKRPLNLTFTPTNAGDAPMHIEYDVSTSLRTTDFTFSATLLNLGREGDADYASGRDAQVAIGSADTYEGRHVVISAGVYHCVEDINERGYSPCALAYFQLIQWSRRSSKRDYRKTRCPNTSVRTCMSLIQTRAISTSLFQGRSLCPSIQVPSLSVRSSFEN